MTNTKPNLSVRWFYLAIGVIAMLFAGILYAWSILKSPFAAEFSWGASDLALNFTLVMCFFCIGGLLGARLSKRFGHKLAIISAGLLSALGFILTSFLSGSSVTFLGPQATTKKSSVAASKQHITFFIHSTSFHLYAFDDYIKRKQKTAAIFLCCRH